MNEKIPNRWNWNFLPCNAKIEKQKLIDAYIRYYLSRTQQMFEYKGLPDTIPQRDIELLLQVNGYSIVTKVNDKLYAFYGGLGGEPNEYYLPTIATISNPYLHYSNSLKIDTDCIIITNDSMYQGLLPMYTKYATLLTETDISLKLATINTRSQVMVVADNDLAKENADMYIKDLTDGKLGVVLGKGLTDAIKTHDYCTNNSQQIKDLMELQQYLKSSWFIELGLNANYNMKRESINESESQMNDDALLPLSDDMLECRRLGIEKVNKMFGTNISVDFSSAWLKFRQELEIKQDILNSEVNENESSEIEPTIEHE